MINAKELLEKDIEISPYAQFLKKHGLISTALFYKNMNETFDLRASYVILYFLQNCKLPDFNINQRLYTKRDDFLSNLDIEDDLNDYGLKADIYGYVFSDDEKIKKLYNIVNDEYEKTLLDLIYGNTKSMYGNSHHNRYDHGGVHNVIDFEFAVDNGLLAYYDKIKSLEENLENDFNIGLYNNEIYSYYEKKMFYQGMKNIVDGLVCFHNRYLEKLEDFIKDKKEDENLQKLYKAMKNVPFNKPNNFYEAVLSYQMFMFLGGCDEPGRMDLILEKYYNNDTSSSLEYAVDLLDEIFDNIDKKYGHPGAVHVTIGGTSKDNKPLYNDITKACMIAIRNKRMPNVTLRVREDMPQEYWDIALENIKSGYSHPALVNEDLFLDGLTQQYNIPFCDAVDYVFGGCSEVLIQGKTMVDSTWTAYNMLDVFEHTMYNSLVSCNDFNEFYNLVKRDIIVTIKDLANQINTRQHGFGETNIWPFHSLFTDSLNSGVRFSNGGCTYNFDSTNIYGTTNTINSLYTVKKLFNGELGISKEDFLTAMKTNFKSNPDIFYKCKNITKFGNYNEEINEITNDLLNETFSVIKSLKGYRGKDGRFMPAIILWVTWVYSGKKVGATPDGRLIGEALADSSGPMQGTDIEGPTSTMGATLAIPQKDCVGTCVLNIRLDSSNFSTKQGTQKVENLFKTYFKMGGCQLQVNVVDEKTLEDALINPEKHKNLIVRVGGFSDNFIYLSDEIKQEVIKRTKHSL